METYNSINVFADKKDCEKCKNQNCNGKELIENGQLAVMCPLKLKKREEEAAKKNNLYIK